MRIERSARVATEYRNLIAATRESAGAYMRDAWNAEPATEDRQMNISDIDFSSLKVVESAYLNAVADDLPWWKFWR